MIPDMGLAHVAGQDAKRWVHKQDRSNTSCGKRNRSLIGIGSSDVSRRDGQADRGVARCVVVDRHGITGGEDVIWHCDRTACANRDKLTNVRNRQRVV